MRRNEERMPARRDQGGALAVPGNGGFAPAFLAASPWQMMRRMQEEMDRVFGQVLGGGGVAPGGLGIAQQLAPSMDISEDDREWRIEVDLPGVRADDIEIRIQDRQLILRAEIRPDEQEERREEGGRRYLRQERRYGLFETVLALPENVQEAAVRCDFRDGVLTVHLPKAEQQQQQSRRIPVGAGTAQPTATASQQGQSSSQREAGSASASTTEQSRDPERQPGDSGRNEQDQERPTAGAGAGDGSRGPSRS